MWCLHGLALRLLATVLLWSGTPIVAAAVLPPRCCHPLCLPLANCCSSRVAPSLLPPPLSPSCLLLTITPCAHVSHGACASTPSLASSQCQCQHHRMLLLCRGADVVCRCSAEDGRLPACVVVAGLAFDGVNTHGGGDTAACSKNTQGGLRSRVIQQDMQIEPSHGRSVGHCQCAH